MERKIAEGADNIGKMTERFTQMVKEIPNIKGPWDESKREALSRCIASRKWDDVIKMYKNYPQSHEVTIDKYSGDTAIHVAISDLQQSRVKKMVELVRTDVLKIGNNKGSTPLHLAASLGSTDICRCIVEKVSNLTSSRNQNGETPLFLAVANGKMDAFLYLQGYCKDGEDEYAYFRRNNGDTILHAAISGQNFDIANRIIHQYPKLVHMDNEQGLSPLDLLAAMPSAFESGNPLIGLSKLIYRCIPVGKLKQKVSNQNPKVSDQNSKSPGDASPEDTIKVNNQNPKSSEDANPKVEQLESHGQDETAASGRLQGQDETAASGQLQGLEDMISIAILCLVLPIVLPCAIVYGVIRWVIEHVLSLVVAEFKLAMCIPVKRGKECQEDKDAANEQVDHSKNSQPDEEAANDPVDRSESHQQEEAAASEEGSLLHMIGVALECMVSAIGSPLFVICFLCAIFVCWAIIYISSLVMAVFKLVKFISGYEHYVSLKDLKERCKWSVEVMNELLITHNSMHGNEQPGACPHPSVDEHQDLVDTSCVATTKMEKSLLIAAKHGVVEMVERILDVRPAAIFDENTEKKNIVMLAAENRHPHLYKFLLQKPTIVRTIFAKVDNNGNSVLHIAAKLEDHQQPWRNLRGAAFQMHMEVKWYNYVRENMPYDFLSVGKEGKKTPEKLFEESHDNLIKEGRKWLIDNSQSCSVVAALIATVAFATSATFPGGFKQDHGIPALENDPIFIISAVASLIALCSSMISVVMFLGILTSSFQIADFRYDLPIKHLVAMVSLLVSILSMSISFLAGHHFVLKHKLKDAALPVYIALCISLLFFIIITFPLDYPTIRTILRKKPRQCGKSVYSRISL